MRKPLTKQELEDFKARIEAEAETIEAESPELRPLPPMGRGECFDLLIGFSAIAKKRTLFCGRTVRLPGIEIILSDIGFEEIQRTIDAARHRSACVGS